MEDEIYEVDSLEALEQAMNEETDPEKKLKLAQAYKTMKEAKDSDWNFAQEQELENKKSKRVFWATIIAALSGSAVAGIIKAISNDLFQRRAIEAEQDDIYVKPQKMLPPNK